MKRKYMFSVFFWHFSKAYSSAFSPEATEMMNVCFFFFLRYKMTVNSLLYISISHLNLNLCSACKFKELLFKLKVVPK